MFFKKGFRRDQIWPLFGCHINILGLTQQLKKHLTKGAHVLTRGAMAP